MSSCEQFCRRKISDEGGTPQINRSTSPNAGNGFADVEIEDLATGERYTLPSNLLEWWPEGWTEDEVKVELF